jgi:hypothetical protein
MRLILHIGMPKAGSSALQAAFVETRRELRKAGILYPKGTFNHNFLIAGMVTPAHLGRVFAQHYADNADAVGEDFTAFWRNIVDAIERRRPSVVVMSAESLFGGLGHAGPGPLRALLAPLGAQTEIVCYVRRPSEQYLALAQQRLKASWDIYPVRAMTYRPQLEAAAAAADRLHVIPYDRSRFPDGDIVADFASRFLPEAEAELRAATNPSQNASMSAEAMDIVQGFRRDRHPDENNRFTRDTGLLRRRLAEREAELGGQQRPQLLPQVRDVVDLSSVDILWLRDTFGIVFNGIDYLAVGARPGIQAASVTDICVVNPERRAALAELATMTAPVEAVKPKRFRTVFSRPRS